VRSHRAVGLAFLPLFVVLTSALADEVRLDEDEAAVASPTDAVSTGEDAAEADEPAPLHLAEDVTVTASREPVRLADTPASVAVVDRAALEVTAAPTVDDALRQVVGFSLFRRTGSRTANPTIQGVSLRGVGASGASRAQVLADGLPLVDPFGGWIYWGRVPRLAVDRLEVLRGGASSLYGGPALGGAVQILTRRPPTDGSRFAAEGSGGESGFLDGAATAEVGRGRWEGRLSVEGQRFDGYVPVDPAYAGPVDRPAGSEHAAVDALFARRTDAGRVFVHGAFYGESRDNGTALQVNDTQIGLLAVGLDHGAWTARLWGSSQELEQSFTAVSGDRSSETLVREQRVPANALGLSAQWSGSPGGAHRLSAGIELGRVDGTTFETGYFGGAPTSRLEAGGVERRAAAWIEDTLPVGARLVLTASARLDYWQHHDGREITRPIDSDVPRAQTRHPDRSETAASPRLGVLFRVSDTLSATASGYGSFRAPTLNELYRGFRVGSVVTQANADLVAERLWGGEAGVRWAPGPVALRVTAFDAVVNDPVANVTVSETPSLITRRRENLGRLHSRGLETEVEARLGRRGVVTAGYTLTDARVSSFPVDPSLEGLRVPQVPKHQAVLQARYESDWRLGLQLRWTGKAYDDDRNTLELDPAFVVDALVSRAVGGGVEVFAAAENLFDARVVAGRTPIPTLGTPRVIRGGVRLRMGEP